MEDFGPDFMDDFLDMLKDTLTVEIFTPGAEDANGIPIGAGSSTVYRTQPCADEDVTAGKRAQFEIVDGVAGAIPVSICLTAWFAMPTLTAGQSVAYRVNGRWRALLKQGPPTDMGAQKGVYQLSLGPPQLSR